MQDNPPGPTSDAGSSDNRAEYNPNDPMFKELKGHKDNDEFDVHWHVRMNSPGKVDILGPATGEAPPEASEGEPAPEQPAENPPAGGDEEENPAMAKLMASQKG